MPCTTTPSTIRNELAEDIRDIFNAKDIHDARHSWTAFREIKRDGATLGNWAEENLPEGFTVFQLPKEHQRRTRTTKPRNQKRARLATLFPNEASALRLVTAVLVEISEEWETGKVYLAMRKNADCSTEHREG